MVDSEQRKEEVTPEEGYAVVQMDYMKPPDSEDFLTQIAVYDEPQEVELPPPGGQVEMMVYTAEGEQYDHNTWNPDEME